MKIDIILLYSVLLFGTGIVIGILGMILMLNKKVDRLSSKISRMNCNFDNFNWNNNEGFFEDKDTGNDFNIVKENKLTKENNTVNFMSYKNEGELQMAFASEESQDQQKAKTNQTIGIVFCRNCASQFTSDKDACPICGARRR